MATTNSQEAGSLLDQSIPQWKRELIARRRALGRTLQLGSTTVKLTCPSVVAAVRQPEAIAAVENVIGKQQRCISSVAASNKSSLDQNQADFHPGPSSAVTVAVGNMRLLDKCMNVNNEFVINGSDIQNYRQSEVDTSAFQYISSNMGEEKPVTNLKNTSASNKSVMEKISVKIPRQISIKKENRQPSKNGNNDDCLSDSSEEFQYGPGIVNRLKTRYLSMTLRESQKKGLRPSLSSMRRATSLENMLDEDISSNKTTKTNNRSSSKNDNSTNVLNKVTNISYRTSKHTGLNRGSDSMKRARSMDTLLKADHKSSVLQNHAVLRPKSLISDRPVSNGSTNAVVSIINEDLIIVENTSVDGNTSSNDEHQGLRFRRNAEERDLPPPDVVKQTLKLFETSPSKKSKTIQSKAPINNKVSSSNSVNSLKYNGDKQKADFVYKPILSPKPVLSPEKLRSNRSNRISSPKKIGLQISNNNAILSPRGFTRKRDIEPLSLTISNNTSTGSEIPPLASPRTVSPRCVSPIVTVISHSEQDQTILSPTSSTKLLNLNSRPESLTLNSSSNDDDFDSSDEGESKVPKPVSQTALENIRKGGTSTQFKFNSDNTQPTKIKSYLPGNKVHIQATNSLLVLSPTRQSSLPTATIAPLKSPDPLVPMPKQIGVIRPIVSTKIHPNIQSSSNPLSGLTEQEIEKNLINRVKSIEQPVSKVVVAIKSLPDNIVVGSVSTDSLSNNKGLSLPRVNPSVETKSQGLWDKKPWHQNQNTMVFNFSNRKDVPDYIENDGLILKGQRDRPRVSFKIILITIVGLLPT